MVDTGDDAEEERIGFEIIEVVAENEQLHERLAAELEREPSVQPPAPPSNDRSVIQGPSQERARELAERVDILMAENALMVEQTAVLQAELDRCSTDLDSRTKEAASFRDEAERATEKWRALEGGEGQWREARRRLEERYVQHSTDMAQAQAQPGPGPAQARPKPGPGQISGNLEIWNLEIWKFGIQKIKT